MMSIAGSRRPSIKLDPENRKIQGLHEDANPSAQTPLIFDVSKVDGWLSSFAVILASLLALQSIIADNQKSTLGLIILAFYGCNILYFGMKVFRNKPWTPLIVATEKGIYYSRFSSDLIPWSDIDHIGAIEMKTRVPSWRMDIRVRADADPEILRKSTVNSALFTHVPGKPNISISAGEIKGVSYIELATILSRCRRRYLTPEARG